MMFPTELSYFGDYIYGISTSEITYRELLRIGQIECRVKWWEATPGQDDWFDPIPRSDIRATPQANH